MESGLPTPTVRLFRRDACVFVPTFIKELVRTIGQVAPRKCRDGINHLPKFALARLQSFFSFFAIIDIRKQQIPAGYRTVRISHRKAANLEPSINAIRAPATVFHVIDLPAFDGFSAGFDYARKVIWMNGANERPVLQL